MHNVDPAEPALLAQQDGTGDTPSRILAWATATVSFAALAWFAFPVFLGTYTEGFEATIGINAKEMFGGLLQDVDLLYPFNGRFFLLTRLSTAIFLGVLDVVTGLPNVFVFRILMGLSLALLVGSIVYILRRFYGVRPTYGVLVCLLFPPIFESAYFFNDNVMAAGFSTLALAVFWAGCSLPTTAVAAGVLGLAVTARPDAAFVAPAFAVLLWFELPDWRTRLRHALLAAPVIALVPIVVYAALGLSYFDLFRVVPRAILLWDRHNGLQGLLQHAVYALSPPGMLACLLGVRSFLYRRKWREVCLCLLVPLVYVMAYGRSLYELRYLLPIAPFLAIAMAEGGRVVLRSRGLPRAAMALALLSLVGPPGLNAPAWRLGIDADGPRPIVGRAWSPLLWAQWLGQLNEGVAALQGAIAQDTGSGGTLVIVSTGWNPDRLVDLLLLEQGFVPLRGAAPETCPDIAEVCTRDAVRVVHIRTHIPFTPYQREAISWRAGGLPCLRSMGLEGASALLVRWVLPGAKLPTLPPGKEATTVYAPAEQPGWLWADPGMHRRTYTVTRVPVLVIGSYLPMPRVALEQQAAEEIFAARARLLQ